MTCGASFGPGQVGLGKQAEADIEHLATDFPSVSGGADGSAWTPKARF